MYTARPIRVAGYRRRSPAGLLKIECLELATSRNPRKPLRVDADLV